MWQDQPVTFQFCNDLSTIESIKTEKQEMALDASEFCSIYTYIQRYAYSAEQVDLSCIWMHLLIKNVSCLAIF